MHFIWNNTLCKWALAALLFVTAFSIEAQTLRGRVYDADNHKPLAAATISLEGPGSQSGFVTDTSGYFRFDQLPIGHYQVKASFLGFESQRVLEVLVAAGKENVLEIYLREQATPLDEVVVQASRSAETGWTPPASIRTLTLEETLRFPATYYDPARLTTAFAGVVGDNDQGNGLVVRGNSPTGLSWRLEGLEIVNPNHTSNAGTFSDRPTQNGGGVNMLSTQLLGNSYFLSGAFPAEYGNVLSGVLDMRLRPGNNEQREWTVQAGLIGLDLAAEGPMGQSGGASYLVNYRYSTVGLLTALGMDFGGEAIAFQDLAFNLSLPTQTAGRFTLFGMGGNSSNLFEAQRDSTLWEFQKDRYDIEFRSRMGALGMTHVLPTGKRTVWRSALSISGLRSTRTADRLDAGYLPQAAENDELGQSKWSFTTGWNTKLNARQRISGGVFVTRQSFDLISSLGNNPAVSEGSGNGATLQPYLKWQGQLGKGWELTGGLHYLYFTFNQTQSLEPRMSLAWRRPDGQRLSLSYGLHSQLQAPQLYFARINGGNPNESLGLTRAHHAVLAYGKKFASDLDLQVEAYYQHLFKVPILNQPGASFSALNFLEGIVAVPLENVGTGDNYGLEVTLQKWITGRYFFLTNASLYESTYIGGDGIRRDTRFNGNYLFNAMAGKEWPRERNGKHKTWGLNSRLVYAGGFRDTPIDAAASAQTDQTVYLESEAYSLQQPAYFRMDIRAYLRKSKNNRSSLLALDIQNATNAQNVAFSYYDAQQRAIIEKFQLGLIPILSYRLEF